MNEELTKKITDGDAALQELNSYILGENKHYIADLPVGRFLLEYYLQPAQNNLNTCWQHLKKDLRDLEKVYEDLVRDHEELRKQAIYLSTTNDRLGRENDALKREKHTISSSSFNSYMINYKAL